MPLNRIRAWGNWIGEGMRFGGIIPVLRGLFGGQAIILMLHEIQSDQRKELMTGTSVAFFEQALHWLIRHGWEFASLDDCVAMLAAKEKPRNYVVITFDDAYRDLACIALPILERFNAQFTIYAPTGALTRALPSWWLGVRQLLRDNDRVVVDCMGRIFSCPDYAQKLKAYAQIVLWVHQDYRRAAMMTEELRSSGISLLALNDAYFLGESEFQALAQHRLVSVGGHTVSHPALATLDQVSASREIADNRAYLERLTDRSVRHFAYPYGTTSSFGPRDQELVQALGFVSAVSALKDGLGDLSNRFSLPRLPVGGRYSTTASLEASVRGIQLLARRLRPLSRPRQRESHSLQNAKPRSTPLGLVDGASPGEHVTGT